MPTALARAALAPARAPSLPRDGGALSVGLMTTRRKMRIRDCADDEHMLAFERALPLYNTLQF